MKKKLLLTLLVVMTLVCLFAISISAAGSTSNQYGEITPIEGVETPTTIDTSSRVVLKASDGTFYTFPSYYILADNTEFTWKINTEVNAILGINETNALNMKNYVVRMEIPEGIVTINKADRGGAYAFEKSTSIIEFTWPSTLNYIGNYSFGQCSKLANIVNFDKYFKNVVFLGKQAFYQNVWGEGMTLEIPDGITTLPERCFQNTKISKAVIPSSVTVLKNHVFASCTNLTKIEFKDGTMLTEIGNYCFEYTKITSFDFTPFAKTMTSIGEGLFNGCTLLTTVTGYGDVDCATVIGYKMFYNCPLTGIELPKYITKIDGQAFYSYDGYEYFDIPDTVTEIGTEAFKYANITGISLPTSLVKLKNHAFAGCTSLTTVDTTGCTEVEYIGRYCFEDANALTSFDFTPFGDSFTTFEVENGYNGAFNRCTSLATVTGLDKLTSLKLIPGNTFYGCPITEIKLPDGLVEVGYQAFRGHNSTQAELRIPNSVTTINGSAFIRQNNSNQQNTKIYLSANLTTLGGSYTFEDWKFSEIYIPAGVSIPEGMFNRCSSRIVFYYTGAKDTLTINSQNNSAITDAEWVTLEQYQAIEDKTTKNYVIYNYNFCDAFYNGVHNTEGVVGVNQFKGDKYVTDYICVSGCSRNCGKQAETKLCGPLFTNKGYSKIADGTMFTYGIVIDEENIAKYVELSGKAFNYGVIIGAANFDDKGNLIETNAIIDNTGKALIESSIVVDFSKVELKNFTIYNVKMCEINTSAQQQMPIYCCAYIIDGDAVSYMGNEVTENAKTISSSTITVIETTTTTPPATGDDQNA